MYTDEQRTAAGLPTHAEELAIPAGLSALARKAAETIIAFLRERDMASTGGCRAFYSPAEWKARGEEYGKTAMLIVVYDGGDHRGAFCMDEELYKTHEAMDSALKAVGVYAEECTGWYSAIYPI